MSLDLVWGAEPCLGKQGQLPDPWEGELGYRFGWSIHLKVKVSVLGNVGDAWSRLGTSHGPRCPLSWADKIPAPPPLQPRQQWAAEAAVAAASAQVWAATPRARQARPSLADGGRRSGGEAGAAVSSSAGTHSCPTAAHRFGCWPCRRPRQCSPRWGSPSRCPLGEGAPRYC